MSVESLRVIHDAIQAHMADVEQEGILTDWFIGYASMYTEEDTDDYITRISYTTSESSSPHGTFGVATLAIRSMTDDIEGN